MSRLPLQYNQNEVTVKPCACRIIDTLLFGVYRKMHACIFTNDDGSFFYTDFYTSSKESNLARDIVRKLVWRENLF